MPAWAEANKPCILEFITFADAELKSRPFIAGDAFTVADITGLIAIDFMKPAKLVVPDDLKHLKRWHAELRPGRAHRPDHHAADHCQDQGTRSVREDDSTPAFFCRLRRACCLSISGLLR